METHSLRIVIDSFYEVGQDGRSVGTLGILRKRNGTTRYRLERNLFDESFRQEGSKT